MSQHAAQGHVESFAYLAKVGQRQIGLIQLTVLDLLFEHLLNDALDFAPGGVRQRAHRSFGAIGQHDDGSLFGPRFLFFIAVVLFIHPGPRRLPRLVLEDGHYGGPVMLADYVDDGSREPVELAQMLTVPHVSGDGQLERLGLSRS
jgi:hypothetical protein